MTISLLDLDLYILIMKTRMPFRYGIAVMTALPYLFVRLTVEIDGQPVYGLAHVKRKCKGTLRNRVLKKKLGFLHMFLT